MKDLFAMIIGFILVIIGGVVAICTLAFNLALVTLPIWGGALILIAIFG